MGEHARPRKKPSSVETDERIWELHVLPQVGGFKVAEVTRADVCRLHTRMSEAERVQLEVPAAIATIRLLILTGCRVGEILHLKWQEVDIEKRCLRLSDSKTGRKTVYLNTAAIQILARIDRSDDSPYVIRGAKPDSHLVGLSRPWFKIRRRAGLDDVRLHDIRHTYASYGAGMGLSLPIIGKLLGHTQAVTTQRYAHLAADPMREAAERIGSTLEAALAGRPKAPVIEIKRSLELARPRTQ